MRIALLATTMLVAFPATQSAFAQSARNASDASQQTSVAAGAIGESGLRAASGVVAVPLGATAVASGAIGVGAFASGQHDSAKGFSAAAVDTSKGAKELVDFSNAPLTITSEVVRGKQPQAAPHVPYTPAAQ